MSIFLVDIYNSCSQLSHYRDIHGNTPVHLASSAGYTHTLKLLLEIHSHLINAANKVGDTPLHLAARDGHGNVVTMLLTLGAKIAKNTDGLFFLELAIQNEHKEVCVAVVSHDRCVPDAVMAVLWRGRCVLS